MDQPRPIILYIEDDPASQHLVDRVLTRYGYQVTITGDGLAGMALARQLRPDLVLVDVNLPSMDGHEVAARLRGLASFEQTPIVAVTARSTPGEREQALAAGCSGFLTKPIEVSSLPGQIAGFLQGKAERLDDAERSRQLEYFNQRLLDRLEGKVQELQSANQRLRELDRMKSDFIVLVSHEMRTPLTLISGYTRLLDAQLGQTGGQTNQALQEIADGLEMGTSRLNRVINEIINFSRVTSGTLDLALGPVRLASLVEQCVAQVDELCRQRNLTLHVHDLSGLPVIKGDGAQLRIVLENLLGNAIKFTPDGGTICIEGEALPRAVRLCVRDSGIGVAAGEQRHIFNQFYRLGDIQHHSTSKSAFQGGGLGIGLAMARGIVEAHDGRIWIESEGRDPERLPGSAFYILLPTIR